MVTYCYSCYLLVPKINIQEISILRRSFSRNGTLTRRRLESRIGEEYSIDYEDTLARELSNDDMKEMLKTFREGGRYEYRDDNHNHFEIKYW
jgi:hypothetical protein